MKMNRSVFCNHWCEKSLPGVCCFIIWAVMAISLQGLLLSVTAGADEQVITGEEPSEKGKSGGESFRKGYKLFESGAYKKAAPLFYAYLRTHSPEDDEYNWAEFFLGISLKKDGLSHASVDILSHLIKRNPAPKIVQYTLEMFKSITRAGPFNRNLLVREAVSGRQYPFLEGDAADFVHFYQGLNDWENGFIEWGKEHFAQIRKHTYFYYESLYRQALYNIYNNRIDAALSILREILGGNSESRGLHSEARQTMARLLYERGNYEESLKIYQRIDDAVTRQAKNLLERAWNHFRLGNAEKAMGLLYAYSAPGFENSFSAEYFLLKSLIYKSVCHYQTALSVVSEFRKHYSDSLTLIYSRGVLKDDQSMLGVLLRNRKIKEVWELIGDLEKERDLIDYTDQDFAAYIAKSYQMQIDSSANILRRLISKEYEKIADQLLHYEEKASLMEYEIGIDISRRASQFHYDDEEGKKSGKKRGGFAVYPFQGEFWSDELADYRVTLENRCSGTEEWDIFLN